MRKHPNIHELEDLTLLRWQYSLNWGTDSVESLSKSQLPFCKNWQAVLKFIWGFKETERVKMILEKNKAVSWRA